MENVFENLKKYFENTPQDVLEQDWQEIEYLNEIGPDVFEYIEYIKENHANPVEYMCQESNLEAHHFCETTVLGETGIALDAQYYYAA